MFNCSILFGSVQYDSSRYWNLRLDPAKAKRPKRNNADANQLIRALRSAKALAVHNGLLDLLHLYHGFIGDLPKDAQHRKAKSCCVPVVENFCSFF